jgi:hypothetical protein
VDWTYGESLLQRVSEVAQALEELALFGWFKVKRLEVGGARPLFPCLEKLYLTCLGLVMPPGISNYEDEYVQNLEKVLFFWFYSSTILVIPSPSFL